MHLTILFEDGCHDCTDKEQKNMLVNACHVAKIYVGFLIEMLITTYKFQKVPGA